ncbi:hypothetical protein [Roseofilum casamattae]|uniref:Uncharacterized protein n=1 Tax=Roseofilum casamattae BLCC-M143 TaxID=3022442 RepID=A0ABT7BSG9_9CYAN|nr:hypothetical protein [Roseofilum casamattae]MDJ1181717.1 hypothetical protein [Roseofilum casamattae BLCC-M143]
MSFWAKIPFERQIYAIDLDRIDTFICAANGKISFWLPESRTPIVLMPQSSSDGYLQVKNYIHECLEGRKDKNWIKFHYDRNDYFINLLQISLFAYHPGNKKLTFWLPNSQTEIVLSPKIHEQAYQEVLEYVREQTDFALDED